MLFLANMALTILTAGGVGPAAWKLEQLFGLVGWAGRIPFYLLLLYIGPMVLWLRPSIRNGMVIGLAMTIPLALWSVATKCPLLVPVVYSTSGMLQGGLLSWLATRQRESVVMSNR
jgi:hypothetical protein